MEKKVYIAYGSNLNVSRMRHRCPGATVLGKAKIPDYVLAFKGDVSCAYLTIVPETGAFVPAAVWEVSAMDERRLDDYEGYPLIYAKKEMILTVYPSGGGPASLLKGFIYIMRDGFSEGNPEPSYFKECLRGYRDFGFDEKGLYEALGGGVYDI